MVEDCNLVTRWTGQMDSSLSASDDLQQEKTRRLVAKNLYFLKNRTLSCPLEYQYPHIERH